MPSRSEGGSGGMGPIPLPHSIINTYLNGSDGGLDLPLFFDGLSGGNLPNFGMNTTITGMMDEMMDELPDDIKNQITDALDGLGGIAGE